MGMFIPRQPSAGPVSSADTIILIIIILYLGLLLKINNNKNNKNKKKEIEEEIVGTRTEAFLYPEDR